MSVAGLVFNSSFQNSSHVKTNMPLYVPRDWNETLIARALHSSLTVDHIIIMYPTIVGCAIILASVCRELHMYVTPTISFNYGTFLA